MSLCTSNNDPSPPFLFSDPTCIWLITVVIIFTCSFIVLVLFIICQTDNAAPVDVVVVEQAASATPIEMRVAFDGVGVHMGRVWELSSYLSYSLPFIPLSQSVVTVIMQLTLISLLLINKFRLSELEIEFTRQRLGIETRVEAAQVFLLLRPHHWSSKIKPLRRIQILADTTLCVTATYFNSIFFLEISSFFQFPLILLQKT